MIPPLTRREFASVTLAGLTTPLAMTMRAAKINSRIGGVTIGIQTFSLRTLPREGVREALVSAMTTVGLGECELFSPHVEPNASEVPDVTAWRLSVPLTHFTAIRQQFTRAGIDIAGYNPRLGMMSDAEIDRMFLMTKALGARVLHSNIQPAVAHRVAPLAEKHKIAVAITRPDPEIFAMSKYFRLCYDIGDATKAGNDPMKTVVEQHDRLTDIHLKDCKFKGTSVPFGTGDSQMKEVLQFLQKKKSKVVARIDCDYPGTGASVEEVQRCFDYVKSCLT
jgi:sugar phosphate isomerase/epimerase